MSSTPTPARSRKRPEERREEIVDAAAAIALESGMERITLRAVAERLGVRPGLITHYFPAAEDLVVEAFSRAAVNQREKFFPDGEGSALRRMAHFVDYVQQGLSSALARLWLNAQHLARFIPALDAALEEQDALDRARLSAIIVDGVAAGEFADVDAEGASIRIFAAVDGRGSYVNRIADLSHPAYRLFVADVTEWTLGLAPGALARALDD
ncbi:TetR family transcriptional regulator [Microbacterium sp. NPDC089695]|uniref:TetR family transcriptional regulator n=1 Tax=Microbacterium sp. NPDC089695 TaxID=3364198 RepID=UPI0038037E5D